MRPGAAAAGDPDGNRKEAAQYCAEQGIEVILDPAPAAPCDGQLLRCTDFITPNEGELKKIACEDDMEKGARKLLDAGVKNVIKKAGAKGCYFINRDRMDYIAGFKVKAADTTGAGILLTQALQWLVRKDMRTGKHWNTQMRWEPLQ